MSGSWKGMQWKIEGSYEGSLNRGLAKYTCDVLGCGGRPQHGPYYSRTIYPIVRVARGARKIIKPDCYILFDLRSHSSNFLEFLFLMYCKRTPSHAAEKLGAITWHIRVVTRYVITAHANSLMPSLMPVHDDKTRRRFHK